MGDGVAGEKDTATGGAGAPYRFVDVVDYGTGATGERIRLALFRSTRDRQRAFYADEIDGALVGTALDAADIPEAELRAARAAFQDKTHERRAHEGARTRRVG